MAQGAAVASRGPSIQRRGTRRWARYDFKIVAEARTLHAAAQKTREENPDMAPSQADGYRRIAAAVNQKHGTSVHWCTIRDWVNQYWRVLR